MGLTQGTARVHVASPSPTTAIDLEPHLRRWTTRMRAAGMADTTIAERPRQIRHLATVEGLDVFTLDEDDILAYLASPDLSKNSRSTYYYGLRAWHAYLVARGIRDDNPMHGVACPKVPTGQMRPILSTHIEALLTSGLRSRTRGMVLLGAYAGLRCHEIAKIRAEDIDHRAGVMEVVGKGEKARYVPMHALIGEYSRITAPSRGFWFPSKTTQPKPMHVKSVVMGLSRAMDRCSVPGTAHSLRRWFATTMVEEGVDIRVVQELLGHVSLATTQKYLYVQPARAMDAVSRLPVLA